MQLKSFPLIRESREPYFACEELLHGGLLKVALLGDEAVQPGQQRINVAKRGGDSALFGERRLGDYELANSGERELWLRSDRLDGGDDVLNQRRHQDMKQEVL